MPFLSLFISIVLSTTCVTITEPVDGETYDGDWLTVRAIVENENELPDSVHYTLNGEPVIQIPRLNTDWYTYMANDCHTGWSASPAPHDNTILWTAQVTGVIHEFPTPVIVDGIVYYPSDMGTDSLYALDAATGDILWKCYKGVTDDAVTVKDGYLYTSCDSLWCLDALTGERIWAIDLDGEGATPAVADGGVFCGTSTFSPSQSHFYRFNALTGDEVWYQTFSGYMGSCPTVWNGMVFVPTENGALNALDASTGSIIWQNTDSDGGYWDSSPVIVDGNIYISGNDGKTRAIDAMSGSTVWEEDITPGYCITATPAYHDGRLFFADQMDTYHCIDAGEGSTIWALPGSQHGSSAVADGLVFYGDLQFSPDSALIRALDIDTGAEVWSYKPGGQVIYGSPALTDGVLYMPAHDWNLYAFGTGLKYTYLDDLFADLGSNELIVTSFEGVIAVAADTINFTVTQTGITLETSTRLCLRAGPNPFNSTASISFELLEPGMTRVTVYDLSGRIITTLTDEELREGQHMLQWSGTGDDGQAVSAGIYICRIQSGEISETTGLCLLR